MGSFSLEGRCLRGLRVQRHSCWCDGCGVTTAHHLAEWDAAKARLDKVAAASNGDEGAGLIIPLALSFTAHPVHTPGRPAGAPHFSLPLFAAAQTANMPAD